MLYSQLFCLATCVEQTTSAALNHFKRIKTIWSVYYSIPNTNLSIEALLLLGSSQSKELTNPASLHSEDAS
jgi:hypothetical protein